jgi:hypothetical protein
MKGEETEREGGKNSKWRRSEGKERKGEVTTASKKNSGRTMQPSEQTKEIRGYPITTLIVHLPDWFPGLFGGTLPR